MWSKRFSLYVAGVSGLALAGLLGLEWGSVIPLIMGPEGAPFWALLLLGILAEALSIGIVVEKHAGYSSISFIPIFSSVLLFGPGATAVFVATIVVTTEVAIRRRRSLLPVFNVSQQLLAVAIAGLLFKFVGGYASTTSFELRVLPFVTFGAAFLAVNHVAVAGGIAIKEGVHFGQVIQKLSGPWGTNLLYDLFISPVALVVAFLYVEIGIGGLVLSLLPLLFIRHAYATNLQLQQANRDILQALVKAIETRDPYTSGHSMRVAWLATEIAQSLGLSKNEIETIKTSALLHDIGKIEVIYAEILKKPQDLTDEERRIIQSHATKGADLLRSLSSFPDSVIDAVKHHHERWDGRGYPEGLEAHDIPLGARIIMVCDAVDAMLSDRPYRDALSMATVKEELSTHSERQFDPGLVSALLYSDLLEEHRNRVSSDKPKQARLPSEREPVFESIAR